MQVYNVCFTYNLCLIMPAFRFLDVGRVSKIWQGEEKGKANEQGQIYIKNVPERRFCCPGCPNRHPSRCKLTSGQRDRPSTTKFKHEIIINQSPQMIMTGHGETGSRPRMAFTSTHPALTPSVVGMWAPVRLQPHACIYIDGIRKRHSLVTLRIPTELVTGIANSI